MQRLYKRSRRGLRPLSCLTILKESGLAVTRFTAISSAGSVDVNALQTAASAAVRHVVTFPGYDLSFLEVHVPESHGIVYPTSTAGGSTGDAWAGSSGDYQHEASSGAASVSVSSSRDTSSGGASDLSSASLRSVHRPFRLYYSPGLVAGCQLSILTEEGAKRPYGVLDSMTTDGKLYFARCSPGIADEFAGAPVLVGSTLAGIHMRMMSEDEEFTWTPGVGTMLLDEAVRHESAGEGIDSEEGEEGVDVDELMALMGLKAPDKLAAFVPMPALMRCMRQANLVGPTGEEVAVRTEMALYKQRRAHRP